MCQIFSFLVNRLKPVEGKKEAFLGISSCFCLKNRTKILKKTHTAKSLAKIFSFNTSFENTFSHK